MSSSTRPNPFKAFLPDTSSTAGDELDPPHSCLIRNTLGAVPLATDVDALDKYLLACARRELPLNELLGRLPCSRAAALQRIRGLITNGSLAVRHAPSSSAPALDREVDLDKCDTVRPSPSRNAPGTLRRANRLK